MLSLKQIPADMVVNAMLVAMMAHANQHIIYHVGSSVSNPIRYHNFLDYSLRYFTTKPWINKDGKPIKVGKVTIFEQHGELPQIYVHSLLASVKGYFKSLFLLVGLLIHQFFRHYWDISGITN